MTTCVSCWKYITLLCFTLESVNTVSTVKTSKACYGVSGVSCTRHNLSCSNTQKTISICDAYYTDNKECGASVTDCSLNPEGLTEHGYHRFSNEELAPIFDRCSTQTECVYSAPWRGVTRTFSVLKYQCIKTSTPFNNTCEQVQTKGTSGLTTITRNNISSTWMTDESTTTAAGATKTSKACRGASGLSCTGHDISCNSNQQIAIYDAYYTDNTECGAALSSCTVNPDSVTEHGYHRFNNAELVSLYNHCSTETRCVYRATRHSAALAFSVVRYQCTERGFTTESTTSTSPMSTSRQFPAGVFVGGVAVGVVIVILVCLAVYVLVVRRRYDLTPKKQGDTPASIEHPTYSGMSAGGDVNNYDIIEQTSGFQGDTAHEVVATPDYQNV